MNFIESVKWMWCRHQDYSGLPALCPFGATSLRSMFKFVPDKFVDPSGFEFRIMKRYHRRDSLTPVKVVPAPGFEPGTY
jgi:hypothetical protein